MCNHKSAKTVAGCRKWFTHDATARSHAQQIAATVTNCSSATVQLLGINNGREISSNYSDSISTNSILRWMIWYQRKAKISKWSIYFTNAYGGLSGQSIYFYLKNRHQNCEQSLSMLMWWIRSDAIFSRFTWHRSVSDGKKSVVRQNINRIETTIEKSYPMYIVYQFNSLVKYYWIWPNCSKFNHQKPPRRTTRTQKKTIIIAKTQSSTSHFFEFFYCFMFN